MEDQQKRWNRIFEGQELRQLVYDDWLDKYGQVLGASKDTPVADLGCGYGNNTLYLRERGYQVISCDFAEAALKRLSHFVPNAVTCLFDLRDQFPFEDRIAKVVVADLCLHYFSEAETKGILLEIRRILAEAGWLLSRVNSTKDFNFGAGEGTAIESLYYEQDGTRKRFFDEQSLRAFFAGWKIHSLHEHEMNRYGKPKIVWEIASQK